MGTSRGEGASSRRSPVLGGLDAAVEEVGHVRVLLGLGDVQLACAGGRDRRRERGRGALGDERHRVGPTFLVLGQRRVARHRAHRPCRSILEAALALAEAGLGERARDLAHAVGTEVERDHAVARPYPGLLADERGLDELVGLPPLIGRAHGLLPAGGGVGRARVDEQVVRPLGALPAAVAVHRPVATDDRAHARPGSVASSCAR